MLMHAQVTESGPDRDALVHDASCDLDAGVMGDLAEDLVEAGVVGQDEEAAIG